jgi:asparagine synthase (glutamine-hydrolysing)
MMTDQLAGPVRTFTIGFEDPRFDESPYADEMAKLCNTDHTLEIVDPNMVGLWPLVTYHNDQPHGDASFMPTYRLSQLARRHVTVVLTGDGGDELFAGYYADRDFFAALPPGLSQEEFERKYVEDVSVYRAADKRALYTAEAAARTRDADAFRCAETHFRGLRHFDRINQILALETKMLLPGNNLVKPDKMAMAVSLEPRSPFLDSRMIELAFRIPGQLKLRDGETKWVLKRALERILPRGIIYRSKQMFTVPVGEWFRDQLLGFVRDILLSPWATARGLFRPDRIETLIEDHRSGRVENTRRLRLLIALEIWHRMFIDTVFDHAPTFAELGLPSVDVAGPRVAAAVGS